MALRGDARMPLVLPFGPSPSSAWHLRRRSDAAEALGGDAVSVCPHRGPGSSLRGSLWNSAQRNPVPAAIVLFINDPLRIERAIWVRSACASSARAVDARRGSDRARCRARRARPICEARRRSEKIDAWYTARLKREETALSVQAKNRLVPRSRARLWPRPVKSSRWPGVFIFSNERPLGPGRLARERFVARHVGARRRRAQRPAPEPTAMPTDVDADASMSALRAKYDATTRLLAAQCGYRRSTREPRRPARSDARPGTEGALRASTRGGARPASPATSRRTTRRRDAAREEVRQDAGASRSRRANDDARDRPSTRDDVFPPPRSGTSSARLPESRSRRTPPRDSRALRLPFPSSPAGDRDRQAPRTRETRGDVRGGCERARPRRGRIRRRERATPLHGHPRRLRRRARRRRVARRPTPSPNADDATRLRRRREAELARARASRRRPDARPAARRRRFATRTSRARSASDLARAAATPRGTGEAALEARRLRPETHAKDAASPRRSPRSTPRVPSRVARGIRRRASERRARRAKKSAARRPAKAPTRRRRERVATAAQSSRSSASARRRKPSRWRRARRASTRGRARGRVAAAEADYAHAEKLAVDAAETLETERARWEADEAERERDTAKALRDAEVAYSREWERRTAEEVATLRENASWSRRRKRRRNVSRNVSSPSSPPRGATRGRASPYGRPRRVDARWTRRVDARRLAANASKSVLLEVEIAVAPSVAPSGAPRAAPRVRVVESRAFVASCRRACARGARSRV